MLASASPSSAPSASCSPTRGNGTAGWKLPWRMGVALSLLLCIQGSIWAKPPGRVVGLGPATHHHRGDGLAFGGILALRAFVAIPPAARLVRGRLHRRLRGRSHRLLLGQMVELAAPGAVHAADRLQRVPLAPPRQRLRHPLPLDRAGGTAVAVASLRLRNELGPPLPTASRP